MLLDPAPVASLTLPIPTSVRFRYFSDRTDSQGNVQYIAQQPSPPAISNRSSTAARLANRMRQVNQTNGPRQSISGKSGTAKNGTLDGAAPVFFEEIVNSRRKAKMPSQNQPIACFVARNSFCYSNRVVSVPTAVVRYAADAPNPYPIPMRGYRAMKCNWFYDTVMNKFREFGSTAVAKNIFGDKYKHIQNMAEEELATVLQRHGSISSDNREFVVNDQKVAPQSMEQAKDAQVVQFRKKLQTLMQNTAKEYQQLENNTSLTEHQKNWQFGRIGVEFRKEAASQMRAFCKTMYITTERHRTMQGASSRNITKQVVATLRDEVSQLVGHPLQKVKLERPMHSSYAIRLDLGADSRF
ncbi:unnamed protein product [Echinostoma caproni]|uniref:Uncharacterized protein n=1 Tax=Echinostoma caproni TaxID=27848 RepID=A0A183AG30_9TREM|nr:unnamed protein product [Echinostoma caproni]